MKNRVIIPSTQTAVRLRGDNIQQAMVHILEEKIRERIEFGFYEMSFKCEIFWKIFYGKLVQSLNKLGYLESYVWIFHLECFQFCSEKNSPNMLCRL